MIRISMGIYNPILAAVVVRLLRERASDDPKKGLVVMEEMGLTGGQLMEASRVIEELSNAIERHSLASGSDSLDLILVGRRDKWWRRLRAWLLSV